LVLVPQLVQLSEDAERKLADERLKEWSKDQEEYTEREFQEVQRKIQTQAEEGKDHEEHTERDAQRKILTQAEEGKEKQSDWVDPEYLRCRKALEEQRRCKEEMEARIAAEKAQGERLEKEKEERLEKERKIEEIRAGFAERRTSLQNEFVDLDRKSKVLQNEEAELERRCRSGKNAALKPELAAKVEERKVIAYCYPSGPVTQETDSGCARLLESHRTCTGEVRYRRVWSAILTHGRYRIRPHHRVNGYV
jgi:hypothetical protein